MTEHLAVFGERRSLIGIVSEPEHRLGASGYPAVILLNSGLLHRVGPNRLYVKIARDLATAGFTVMRFDFSGVGDSQRFHNLALEESSIKETKQAMDFLKKTRGAQTFILAGICSGADAAFRTATDDRRVIGVCMIDAFSFATVGYVLSAYVRCLLKLRSWRRLFAGESEILHFIKEKLASPKLPRSEQIDPFWPAIEDRQVTTGITELASRGVELCFIYSFGGAAHFNYRKAYKSTIGSSPNLNGVRVVLFKGTDHLFSPLHIQKLLVNLIHEWALRVITKQKTGKLEFLGNGGEVQVLLD